MRPTVYCVNRARSDLNQPLSQLFDPTAIRDRALEVAGPKTASFVAAATSRLFAYTWFYTSAGRYRRFDDLAADAFQFAAASSGLTLSDVDIRGLTETYSNLDLWPDDSTGIRHCPAGRKRYLVAPDQGNGHDIHQHCRRRR